ncbi:MAG: hypothetical protein Q7S84_04475 [bacterium]|nr:hypothetical protein [bacterium]
MKIFVYAVIGLVAAVVIVGIVLVGSPGNERAQQFDIRRVNDLQQIQSQAVDYWQRTGKLPATLGEYAVDYRPLTDPETNALYEYRVTASTTFEVCATFFTEASDAVTSGYTSRKPSAPISADVTRPAPVPVGGGGDTWNHPAGRFCFARAINPTLYPPTPKPVATGGCLITGCSGQVCAENEVATTCEFQPEYACYKQYSRCERQGDGRCGWAATPELSQCLNSSTKQLPPMD